LWKRFRRRKTQNEIALSDYRFCRSRVETLPKQGVRDSILSITAFFGKLSIRLGIKAGI
jgi:hypothetical protein